VVKGARDFSSSTSRRSGGSMKVRRPLSSLCVSREVPSGVLAGRC
jgi:hypothetical protein